MKKIIWIILIFFALIPSIFTTSCQEKHQVENDKLDSMELLLQETEEFLKLDLELFSARIVELGSQRNYIDQNYKDTFTLEFGRQLDVHRTVFKTYERAIADHQMKTTRTR